jgi:hypothetical protein
VSKKKDRCRKEKERRKKWEGFASGKFKERGFGVDLPLDSWVSFGGPAMV